MPDLATTLLSNALLVLPLGLLVILMTRWLRHPGLAWALWGLVLLKFVTPAIWSLPIDLPASSAAVDTSPASQESRPVPAPPPASDSDAATSSDRRPAPTSAEAGQLPVARAADSAAIADQQAIVPSVVSTTILTGDDIDTQPATGSDEAATDRATLAPARAVDPVETAAENGKAAALSTSFTQLASRIPQRAFVWLWSVWIAGSLITCAVAAVRLVRFHRLLARAVPADEETISNARELAEPLGLRRLPDIRLADGRIPPLLYGGVRRAVILLPRQLLATLDAESRRTLLAHELAHIARRDHWTRWLELLVRCLYWWHPLAWYAGRRLRDAEEQCCDARVVALLPGSATAYARTILTTVDYLAGNSPAVPTLATGLQPLRRSVRPLHRRLTMIVEHKSTARLSWPSRLILLALAACILPLSLMAQSDDTSPAVDEPSQDVKETRDRDNTIDTAAAQTPAVVIETTDGSQLTADSLRLWPDRVNVLAQGETDGGDDATTTPAEEQQETTITVQRKSYAIDGALGQSVVRLLEQMQRSGLVDPLLAHLDGGNGATWGGEEWNYKTSVTVVTSPPAHEAIGEFIGGLRALRPAPGQSGPEELQIRNVVYDRSASWDTSRELAGLLGEAVRMGHVNYARITSDQQNRMAITTTEPVHKVLRPFIEFLNEQQAQRDAAVEGAPANPLVGGALPPGAAVDAMSEIGEAGSEPELPSEMQTIPPANAGRSLAAGWLAPTAPGATPRVVPPLRPQVVAPPQESEEITVVFREYEVHPIVADQLDQFLGDVEDGLPLVTVEQVGGVIDTSGLGPDDFPFRAEDPPPARLRIVAPAEAHRVLGDFLKLFRPATPKPKDAAEEDADQAIVLIRGEYELDPVAATRFARLLQTSEKFALALQIGEQHGLATPLIVTCDQSRVTVIAERDLQTAIREFIAYLSENWKTAARNSVSDSTRLGGVEGSQSYGPPVARNAAGATTRNEGTGRWTDLTQQEKMHRVIESIDRVLGDDGKGREKALRAIESRGTEALADRLQEIRRETAVSLFPLLEEVERYRDRLGLDHSLVKARHKKLVLERSKQLEDLAVLDEHPQIQVRAWDRLGILVGALLPSQLKFLKEKGYPGGMRVALVRPEGPSAKVGLKKGFALVAVNGVAVTSHGDLETALKLVDPSQSQIELLCMNGNDVLKAKIRLPPAASAEVEGLDLKIAEIELERANEALEFAKRLVRKGYMSQADLKAAELEVLKAQRELERLNAVPNQSLWSTRAREFAQQRTLTAGLHTPWQIMQVIAAAGADAQILVDGEPTSAWEYVSNDPRYNGEPWFVADGDGLHVRPSSRAFRFEGHPNQFAAWLVAGGAGLAFPLHVVGKEFALRDLVEHARQTIDPSKVQSWTLALLAQTVDVDAEWTSEDGETWSVARLLEVELDAGLDRAINHGFDRLLAITLARNSWVAKHGEPTGIWEQADTLINDMIERVQQNQSEDGVLTLRATSPSSSDHELKETGQVVTWLAAALSPTSVDRGAWVGLAVSQLDSMLQKSVDQPMEAGEYFAAVRGMRAAGEAFE